MCTFVLEGAVPTGGWTGVLTIALQGATLVAVLAAADPRRRLVVAACIFAGVCLLAGAIDLVISGRVNAGAERLINGVLVACAPPALVVGVTRSIRRHQAITIEAVSGAVCTYLLIGLFFAFLYGTLDHLAGPFFTGGAPATNSNCLYFSFVTQTTVGYGDLTARTDVGHTLAVAEALIGQVYLVTVVALIVGNLGRARPQS